MLNVNQKQLDSSGNYVKIIPNVIASDNSCYLRSSTATLFGLPGNAVPDDALIYLLNLAQAAIPSGYGVYLGKLIDQNGKGISGIPVQIYSSSNSLVSTITSGTDGLLQAQLVSGTYYLLVSGNDNFYQSKKSDNIVVLEKKMTGYTFSINIYYSRTISITSATVIQFPSWIKSYDLFAVGGGGGGAMGKNNKTSSSGFPLSMSGGGGGRTATLKNVTASKINITIGAGGAGAVLESNYWGNTGYSQGSSGETTYVYDVSSRGNSILLQAERGVGGTADFDKEEITSLQYNSAYMYGGNYLSGSASGVAGYLGTYDRQGETYDITSVFCTNGREDGAIIPPITQAEVFMGSLSTINSKLSDLNTNHAISSGQGTTTKPFGESSQSIIYASGAGAIYRRPLRNSSFETHISNSGYGAGKCSYDTIYTTSQTNQPCDATVAGSGGGCVQMGERAGSRARNGANGIVLIRWNS